MGIKKPLGYYDYTVILTYLGMVIAFCGILFVINEEPLKAVICILGAGVCDMFDGMVATTKKRNDAEKRFGIQIDSLCDLISFGVFPAIFVYMISEKCFTAALVGAIYVLAALIRLAYFNVSEEERQNHSNERRTVFFGVPVTTIAVFLPIVFVIQSRTEILNTKIYEVLLLIFAIGFLTPIEIRKPNVIGKICLVLIGIMELLCIIVLGWDLV